VKAHATPAFGHFIISVSRKPASMMEAFIACATKARRSSGTVDEGDVCAPVVRPRPGHWWPYALVPFYWIAELLPPARESARRLGLVSISQMLNALVWAVDHPPAMFRSSTSRESRVGPGS